MARLIYLEDDKNCREATSIQFTLPNNLTIGEYKLICIRLASAMGYSDKSIHKEFIQQNVLNTVYIDWPEMQYLLSGSFNHNF